MEIQRDRADNSGRQFSRSFRGRLASNKAKNLFNFIAMDRYRGIVIACPPLSCLLLTLVTAGLCAMFCTCCYESPMFSCVSARQRVLRLCVLTRGTGNYFQDAFHEAGDTLQQHVSTIEKIEQAVKAAGAGHFKFWDKTNKVKKVESKLYTSLTGVYKKVGVRCAHA